MKLATHRRTAELFPSCAYVETGNAGVNADDERGQRTDGLPGRRTLPRRAEAALMEIVRGRPVRRGGGRGLARHGARGGRARPRGRGPLRGRCAETLVAVQAAQTDRLREPYVGVEDGGPWWRPASSVVRCSTTSTHAQVAASTPIRSTAGEGTDRPCSPTSSRSPASTAGRCWTPRALAVRTPGDGAAVAARGGVPARGTATGSGSATCTGCSPLPVDDRAAREPGREAAPHHAAYTIRSWVGPVPDDIVDELRRPGRDR